MQRMDIPPRNIVICDLDGTLANDDHRNHHLQRTPRDWDTYFSLCGNDSLYHPVAQLVQLLKISGKQIYILSGRRDDYRAETIRWLQEHRIPYDHLEMRKRDDRTDDNLLKLQWVSALDISRRIWLVLEDRTRVVKAWREAGYTCLQVRAGDF